MADSHVHESVFIDAEPAVVFQYFTAAELMVSWLGQHAELEATERGRFAVDVAGTAVRGHFEIVDPPHRVVFSWGFAGSNDFPPDASTVEVVLTPEHGGTRVDLTHRGLPGHHASQHRSGWARYLTCLTRSIPN